MAKRTQPDHYADLARKEGYPARSVYKLKEIQEKFHILRKGGRVLDIGSSPGSWSMYARRTVGPSGSVVAVDLNDASIAGDVEGYTFILGNAFETPVREELRELGPYDAVLSDAAPKTTGNRIVDTARSAELVEEAIDLAADTLKPGGNLVIKIFQGGDERDLLSRLKPMFQSARFFKPKASRSESFETFLVASGFSSR